MGLFYLKNAKGWVVFGLLLGLCFLAYSNSLHNPFMLDDINIFSDVKLHNLKFLQNAFVYNYRGPDHGQSFNASGLYYRPMAYVITMLSFLAFGNEVFAYHLTNLLLFALMCFMLYLFICRFLQDKILALIASGCFAVHPINVFFVNYITSGIHSLRFIFMMASVILFLRAREGAHKNIFLAGSLLCFGMALLCHEMSMVLPLYILFISIYVSKNDIKQAAVYSCPYFIMLALYLYFRLSFAPLPKGASVSFLGFYPQGPVAFLSAYSRIIFIYLSKLLWPDFIFFLWNAILVRKFAWIWTGGLLLLVMGWYLLMRANSKSLAFFCSTWLIIGFMPVILAGTSEVHLGLIIEPQWLTFSSLGFFLYLAYKGRQLYAGMSKWFGRLLFILILSGWICVTRYNNWIWGDVVRYFDYWCESNEGKSRLAYLGVADYYERRQNNVLARYYYAKAAVEDSPESRGPAYEGLGLMDVKLGLWQNAKKDFLLSIKYEPGNWNAFNNLASVYLKQKDYLSAKKLLFHALDLNHYAVQPRLNLAFIFLLESNYKESIKLYNENLSIVPSEEQSLLGLMDVYLRLGDVKLVRKYSQRLIEHSRDPVLLTDVLVELGSLGQYHLASDAFNKVVRLDPKFKQVYWAAGDLLARQHRYKQAIGVWETGARIDPADTRFRDKISEAMALKPQS